MPAGDQIDEAVLIGHGHGVIDRRRHIGLLFVTPGGRIKGKDFRGRDLVAIGGNGIAAEYIDFPRDRNRCAGEPSFRNRYRSNDLAAFGRQHAGIGGVAGVFPCLARLQPVEAVQGRSIRPVDDRHRIVADRFRQDKTRGLRQRFRLRAAFASGQCHSGQQHRGHGGDRQSHCASSLFCCCSASTSRIGRE